MITAEELVKNESNFFIDDWEEISNLMIKFTKLHVKEALKQASEKILSDAFETYGSSVPDCWSLDSIINAYPDELIK